MKKTFIAALTACTLLFLASVTLQQTATSLADNSSTTTDPTWWTDPGPNH